MICEEFRPLLTQTEEHVCLHEGMTAWDAELERSCRWVA